MRVEALTQDISIAECEGKETDFFNPFQSATKRQIAKKLFQHFCCPSTLGMVKMYFLGQRSALVPDSLMLPFGNIQPSWAKIL